MNSLLQKLAQSFESLLQGHLFPVLREELGPMGEGHEKFVRVLALLRLDNYVVVRHGVGRPPRDRACIARAFVGKAVFNLVDTDRMIERLKVDTVLRRLCGFQSVGEIPDKATFSRAFAEFACQKFPQRVHTALLERTQADRLIGHISRDSTAIAAREKPHPKPANAKPKRASKSHHKTKKPKPAEEMTRLDRQCSGTMTLAEMIADLPSVCDVGTKRSSKGKSTHWVGFKLHMDVADAQIPISCVLTSASVNDTQVAVPLSLMSAQRVANLYDLMDAGYVSSQIRDHSVQLGHVPLIPSRKNEAPEPMLPHQKERFKERTTVERVYSRLKDEFGGSYVRVRGCTKVMAHLMFGVLALTADQTLRLMATATSEPATQPT